MESYLYPYHYDLVTPDGKITNLVRTSDKTALATVWIENISPLFLGFDIESCFLFFNIKSSLAQLGIDGSSSKMALDQKNRSAEILVELKAIGEIGRAMLNFLQVGACIGKLFAADERRRVRDPDYLNRLFGRADRDGIPLLSLGGMQGSNTLVLEKIENRVVAFLTVLEGAVEYEPSVYGFLPTMGKALLANMPARAMLRLHQEWNPNKSRLIKEGELLIVRTKFLYIRTVFGFVANDLLAPGYHHTSAALLEPDKEASGDTYELFGSPQKEITEIPLEFYTLEPHREHVFFADRDQLQTKLEDVDSLFKAFSTAPDPATSLSSVFIVKGTQMATLTAADWISRPFRHLDFPGMPHYNRQAIMVERYIQQQAQYPFLKAIEDGLIASQGVLFTVYFPSPLMKRLLLSEQVQRCLKGIYFQKPSFSYGSFFSHEDRALLYDLAKFAIPVYWMDESSGKILQYVHKADKDSGMFVPLDKVEHFLQSTVFGVYGSNLLEGTFEAELLALLRGLQERQKNWTHPMLHKTTPLSLVTGGGPGAMAVGNRVAKTLNILSCANIVSFDWKGRSVVNEQRQNPYVEAKMTYRLDKLVERQAEFNLDFPLFLEGGIGTDFEFALEEVRRKVGTTPAYPVLLFGSKEYWKKKITSRFRCNLESGTIKGSEWISNCLYAVKNAQEGLWVYQLFFEGKLPIGPDAPLYADGFCTVADLVTVS